MYTMLPFSKKKKKGFGFCQEKLLLNRYFMQAKYVALWFMSYREVNSHVRDLTIITLQEPKVSWNHAYTGSEFKDMTKKGLTNKKQLSYHPFQFSVQIFGFFSEFGVNPSQ